MKNIKRSSRVLIFLLASINFAVICNASSTRVEHQAFSRVSEIAIEWSKHVKTEVSRGKEMDTAHAKQEMASLRSALAEMTRSYVELAKQPESEVAEAHFVAIKAHKEKAEAAFKVLDAEFEKSQRDYGSLNKTASALVAELVSVAKEHKAELSELDVK